MNSDNLIMKNKFIECEELTKDKVKNELDNIIKKIDRNILLFGDKFPMPSTKNGIYPLEENIDDWTQGFWTGMLWIAYEYTKDEKYRKIAEKQVLSFADRIEKKLGVGHHDMGFLYSLSCVAAYKLTKNKEAKNVAIKAADILISRYHEKGEFIQAWGELGRAENYRLIIDCLLNIPLLYWATKETGDDKYRDIAYKHYKTTVSNIIREDGTTYHTFYFDTETGKPLYGVTAQGYSNDSCWARGQAWGVYGSILTYGYEQNEEAKVFFKKATNCFLNKLPDDLVAYWDMIFTNGDEERDSSASAIAVCGLIEGAKYLKTVADKDLYMNAAMQILNSLIDNYSAQSNDNIEGLLLHGVYDKRGGFGVDECMIWGDYFYMEALMRVYDKNWKIYW